MIKYFGIISFVFTSAFIISSCSDNDDTLRQIPPYLNFSPVLNFTTDSLELDITNSTNENSIYISYSDIADIYAENVIKYNLSNLSQTNMTHHDDSYGVQIEVIGNSIFSISYNYSSKFDINLGNNTQISQSFSNSKATKYGNNILLFSGEEYSIPAQINMNVLRFDTSNETYSQIASFPNGNRFRGDGIVYNNKLHIFGGNDGITNYNEINIYDLVSNTWSQGNLPFTVYESFTSLYNNSIVVAGNKNSDSSGAFIGVYDLNTNTFTELTTSLNLSDTSIRGITVIDDEMYIIYTNFTSPFIGPITMHLYKASLL